MPVTTINAQMLKTMFLAGASVLEGKKEYINDLNVFPVPDGDTGTNMSLTIMAAAKEVTNIETITMESIAKAISSGSLRGARGNSGVILSQLLRGFTNVVKTEDEIDIITCAKAFEKAKDTAYKAVMKPKEGTILTVARGISEKALEIAEDTKDFESFLGQVLVHAEEVLAMTPEMLPVLKEAGVVDSGGQGLLEFLKGAYDAFLGKEIEILPIEYTKPITSDTPTLSEQDIKFGYCTEFIVMTDREFKLKDEIEMKSFLESIGDSIVCVADDDMVKIHVHTNDPGKALQKALEYGGLTSIKIDNMREEHEERLRKNGQPERIENKPLGFVAVSIGEGMNSIFSDLGVDHVIEGGQTMNPSTEDMLAAIANVHADTVFILPNNSNIILTANQAKALVDDKEIIVIPTKTVPQGITAMISVSLEDSASDNETALNDAISQVKTGQVTYAVRNTTFNEKEISEGDIMGIADKGILNVGNNISEVAKELIQLLADDDTELISIYYGEEVEEADATALGEAIEELYPDVDVDVQFGGQPIYYYVVGIE